MTRGGGAVKECCSSATSTARTMSPSESISVPSRSKTTADWSLTVGPMEHVAHEERPHLHDELGGLPRAAHGLDHVGERVQLLADEPDDELVVVRVEPVAREADVVGQVGRAVGLPDLRVLAHDASLLLRLAALRSAAAPERVPDRPRPGLVQGGLPRALEEPER